ncbi:MAG: TolC family protein [Myxococcota bacterium]
MAARERRAPRRLGLLALVFAAWSGDAGPAGAQEAEALVVPGARTGEPPSPQGALSAEALAEALAEATGESGEAPAPPAYGDDWVPGEKRRPLELDEVLASVDETYPLLIAVRQELEIAGGEWLSARGGFDSRLFARGELAPTGYYDRFTSDLGIEQPTRLWGSRLYAGYRIGRGDFPADLGSVKTNEDGELRAGLEIPLLKDGSIDAARTSLRASDIKRRAAEPKIELRRLEIVRQAAEAYWNWIAMGLNVDVERHLLRAAEDRRRQLEGRAARGAIPAIQVVDNERLIVDRAIRLRGAERDALEAAVTLSLFYRDANGEMKIPEHDRMPRDFPAERAWDAARLASDVERASDRHPILRELSLRRDGLLASLALNRNALLPDLRVGVEGSKDVGKSSAGIDSIGSFSNNPKDDTEVKATVRFEVPALQRAARGRVATNRAELIRIEQETRYARDSIEAEIRRAMAFVQAAYDQTRLARENYALAAKLQRGEERKFELGSSNLIDVNIREIQTADAARALVFAQAAYFRAIARYEAAIAGRVE